MAILTLNKFQYRVKNCRNGNSLILCKIFSILNNHKGSFVNMSIKLFLPVIFSIQGTCIPSPSPRFTAFPVTTTTHSAGYVKKTKQKIKISSKQVKHCSFSWILDLTNSRSNEPIFFISLGGSLNRQSTVFLVPKRKTNVNYFFE